jgi:hypothetical protein
MNPISIAIAEACSELSPPKCRPSIEQLEAILASNSPRKVVLLPNGEVRSIPDYTNDIRAIQAAVLSQSSEFQDKFQSALNEVAFSRGKLFCQLTAQDWCDAFLHVLNM